MEIAMLVRTLGEIRRAVAENTPRALILRGTAAQIAMSAWLVKELDQPNAAAGAARSYSVGPDDEVRVFYLPTATAMNEFRSAADRTRLASRNQHTFVLAFARAFVIRGTSVQIAQAEQMLK
jgi:hypothetical protein